MKIHLLKNILPLLVNLLCTPFIFAQSYTHTLLGSGFYSPHAIVVDNASGNILVADSKKNAIKKMDSNGGNIQILASGFQRPGGIALDGSGNILFTEYENNTIKKMNSNGSNIITLIGSGFNSPLGIALDSNGNIYLADSGNGTVKRWNSLGGNLTILGNGFFHPSAVAVDALGNVYVADGSHKVKKISVNGGPIQELGSGFNYVYGLAVDASGNIYVADYANDAVKKMNNNGGNIQTLLTSANSSALYHPIGITLDNQGNVYIACAYDESSIIKLSPATSLSTSEKQVTHSDIYPNPVQDKLYLKESLHDIYIYNEVGSLVLNSKTSNQSVDVTSLPMGVYIISGTNEKGKSIKKKFIKK